MDYVRIARLDHWIKNLFILPGFAVALLMLKPRPGLDARLWIDLAVALLATSLASSANYVVNEWLDARFDRFHPTKKHRPVVVSNVKFGCVMAEYAALAVAGLALSLSINIYFALTLAWLLAMGIVYNVEPMRTKDVPFLDVLSESVNNMIRMLLGWFVVTADRLPPVSILLGYWMGGAFLMAAKRFSEYRMIGDPALAGNYRKSFKYYTEASLLVSTACYAMCSTFFVGIFLLKYKIELLLSVPFLIALFCKYLAIACKEDSAAQKPEKLYRERGLMAWCAAFVAVLVLSLMVKLPWLDVFVGIELRHLPRLVL
jgi:decaprenyl-phosphate phosphoribosyltransferase